MPSNGGGKRSRGVGAADCLGEVEKANVYPQVDHRRVPVVNGLGVVSDIPLHDVIKHDAFSAFSSVRGIKRS